MRVGGPEPRHGLTVVYRQECPEIVRHSIKLRRTVRLLCNGCKTVGRAINQVEDLEIRSYPLAFKMLLAPGLAALTSINNCNDDETSTPVIVDYDMNVDDTVAMAYLAKSAHWRIKAVIVTATAFSNRAAGLANTYRMLELLGLQQVEVGVGPYYSSYQWNRLARGEPGGCDYSLAIPRDVLGNVDVLYGTSQDYLPYSPLHDFYLPYHKRREYHVARTNRTPAAEEVYRRHVDAGVTTVLALGSFTSLHKFQLEHPESFARLRTLHAMIGAIDVPGNIFTLPFAAKVGPASLSAGYL